MVVTRPRHGYIVTARRFIEREGLVLKHLCEIRIHDIKHLHLYRSFLERLLRAGPLSLTRSLG